MTIDTNLITADELLRMPRGGMRRELIRGELRETAPSGFDHGAICVHAGSLLMAFVKQHRLGVVVGAETGFRLARNPDTVRAADAGFVRADRLPASGRTEKYFEGAPDLAVEVVSPGDTLSEVEEKVDDYLNAGTSLIWIINPRRKTVTAYRPQQNPIIYRDAEEIDGFNVLPGFTCRVGLLFE